MPACATLSLSRAPCSRNNVEICRTSKSISLSQQPHITTTTTTTTKQTNKQTNNNCHLWMKISRGAGQWRRTPTIGRVDIRTLLDQKTHRCAIKKISKTVNFFQKTLVNIVKRNKKHILSI
jgi:hypothetical protein